MSNTMIGNGELITEFNRRLVLQAVRALQPTYRAEVARHTNLKPATITGIVNDLLETQWLREVAGETKAPGPSGGRPPSMIQINGDAKRILAVDLEPDIVRVGIVGLDLELLQYRETLIDRFSPPSKIMPQIYRLCDSMTDDEKSLDGFGLSLPGLIDRQRGVLVSSTNMPKWKDVAIRDALAEHVGTVPMVEKSVRLAAIHEDWIDRTSYASTKLILSLRTGIGMSLIRDGQLYVGSEGFEGELGHTVVDTGGERCECGNRGCLETFVSTSAICQRIHQKLDEGKCRRVAQAVELGEVLRPELVYRLANEGDEECAEIVREVGHYVGLAAANLVNLLAPDALILCGSIDTAEELILESIKSKLDECALPRFRQNLSIRLAAAKEKSSLIGAAALVAREFFELPRIRYPHVAAKAQSRKA